MQELPLIVAQTKVGKVVKLKVWRNKKEITKNTICNICKNQTHSKRLSRVGKTFAIKL